MQEKSTGLRERQRAETLNRLHEAAVTLVRDEGMTGATVSAIADRAGVSRRTFFNYYASKEDALLGVGPPSLPTAEFEAFLTARTDRLHRAVELVLAVAASIRQVHIRSADRKALTRSAPELAHRMQQHAANAQELIGTALAERFDRSDPDGARAADQAQALVMLAAAVMRFAYQRDPEVIDDRSSPAIQHAIQTFRTTIKDVTND